MIRKKMTKEEKRNHLATVRMNDKEYDMVCESAKEAGMSISEYLRHMSVYGKVDVHTHVELNFPELEALTREFSRIGNNLNQLARYFNAGGPFTAEMKIILTDCINQVMEMRSEVMSLGGEFRGSP